MLCEIVWIRHGWSDYLCPYAHHCTHFSCHLSVTKPREVHELSHTRGAMRLGVNPHPSDVAVLNRLTCNVVVQHHALGLGSLHRLPQPRAGFVTFMQSIKNDTSKDAQQVRGPALQAAAAAAAAPRGLWRRHRTPQPTPDLTTLPPSLPATAAAASPRRPPAPRVAAHL